jgi:hypothetical protein
MFMAQQQVRLSTRFPRVCLFGCLLTLATIVFPHHASAATLTICKKTVPPTATLPGPSFTFTGANTWPASSGKDFTTAYTTGLSPPLATNPFPMRDGDCKTLTVTGHDSFNKITETVPPPPWKLTNISCSPGTSVIKIFGSNPNPAFQPGDNIVSIDQTDLIVNCTFINTCAMSGQDVSTGVGSWFVTRPNGQSVTPHKVPPNSNWASHSPPGPPFPAGTSWVQPANSSTLTAEPPGTYVYQVRFTIPCPGLVKGWFAADNAATLVMDNNPAYTVPCMGNASQDCFKQANVTSFGGWFVAAGTHVIKVTVINQAGSNTLTGLLAHITVQ